MNLGVLRSFLPWIIYFVLVSQGTHYITPAIFLAGGLTLYIEWDHLKKGFVLSWGTLLFFLGMAIGVLLGQATWLMNYEDILSNGGVFLIVIISVLIRKPFTLQFAKEKIPADKWQHPLFIKINYLLTSIWIIIFAIGFILAILSVYMNNSQSKWISWLNYLLPIIGFILMDKFPDWYRKKYKGVEQRIIA